MTGSEHFNQSNVNIIAFLRALAASEFFGSVLLKFERGEVVHIREERNWKPEELPSGTPRCNDATRLK